MIELRDLHVVQALAEELHFGRAGERLGVTSSTVSRRVRAVEEQLGVTLFKRTSRSVALTDAGRHLAAELPGPLRRLDSVLSSTRRHAGGGWEV